MREIRRSSENIGGRGVAVAIQDLAINYGFKIADYPLDEDCPIVYVKIGQCGP
ncbi:MAG TPA: hypothetical protein VE954_32305 [Oligoflexus sp.]|uniref:hypothetical protein n=1 Tax=Oligoflexus sp. TaxID=1971216 RepID=UPI002D297425|nr:hypothetical protein [Oligoflexus sp.]HYX37810.1 hypothetical protein [Oligoflexus sp.]